MRSAPVVAAVLAAAGLVWVAVVVIARGMGAMTGGMPASAGAFIGTWTLMMAAMMLPALAPVAAMYVSLVGERRGHAAGLVGGYLVCWALIGVVALLLVRGVTGLHHGPPDTARILVGVTLIGCGAYQLTPLKETRASHTAGRRSASRSTRSATRGGCATSAPASPTPAGASAAAAR